MKKNKINNTSNENNKTETNQTNFIEVGKNINNENINNDFFKLRSK